MPTEYNSLIFKINDSDIIILKYIIHIIEVILSKILFESYARPSYCFIYNTINNRSVSYNHVYKYVTIKFVYNIIY